METNLKYSKYALVNRQIELNKSGEISSDEGYNVNNNSMKHLDKLMVFPGSLIQIIGTSDGKESEKCIVHIVDFNTFTNTQFYEIKTSYLVKVAEDIWPYVISIVNLDSRLRLVYNKEQCLWLTNLKVNDLLSVQGEVFKKGNSSFDCIIRYIGPVQELNPVGYFFGLELLHLNNGHSPQAKEIPFATKYLHCEPSLSIFATADWITPVSSELKHKLSAKKLINETFERVYTAIVPTTLNLNAQRSDNKYKKRQPTAQFYDSLIPKNTDKYESEKMTDSIKSDDCTLISEENKYNNEDQKVYINNIPVSLERKSTSLGNAKNTCLRKNTANEKDLYGINKASESGIKERDICIINKNDIEEATRNEHNVIIINNPQKKENVDLADLLGTNWPTNAGGAAMILNRTQLAAKTFDSKLESVSASSTYENYAKNKDKNSQVSHVPLDVKANPEQLQIHKCVQMLRDEQSKRE